MDNSQSSSEQESIYIYIDESGVISDNSRFFIIGCCITDNQDELKQELEELKQQIENKVYFAPYLNDDGQIMFHASENHFDIRAQYYSLLSTSNIRSHFIIVDKHAPSFKEMNFKSGQETYDYFLRKLLYDRVQRHKTKKIYFYFEEYGSNQNERLHSIIDNIQAHIGTTINNEIHIASKAEINVSTIDYLNYLIYNILIKDKPDKRMIDNFKLIEPKIASIYSTGNKTFYSSRKSINFDEIKGLVL